MVSAPATTILAQVDAGYGAAAALLFVALMGTVGLGLYFLPTIVGKVRKVPSLGSVVVVNLFLGWTFVGWVVALALAFRSSPPAAVVNMGYAAAVPPRPPAPAAPPVPLPAPPAAPSEAEQRATGATPTTESDPDEQR